MKLSEIDLSNGRAFVAMEYCYLILNRTLLVIATENALIGLKVRGMTSAGSSGAPMTVQGDLNDANTYIDDGMFNKYRDTDLLNDNLIAIDSANFRIEYKDIKNVYHNPKKKWGMGYYPHDGKVYIETQVAKKELIILGDQSGEKISKMLSAAIKHHELKSIQRTFKLSSNMVETDSLLNDDMHSAHDIISTDSSSTSKSTSENSNDKN